MSVGGCDVLACRGSAVGKEGWVASGSQGGENGRTVCAKIEGELAGEIWRKVGGGSYFKGGVSPGVGRENRGFKRTENVSRELYYAWVVGPCA